MLTRNWSFSYDDVADRNRALRDTDVAGRRGILALEQRGLVMIRRESVPVDGLARVTRTALNLRLLTSSCRRYGRRLQSGPPVFPVL